MIAILPQQLQNQFHIKTMVLEGTTSKTTKMFAIQVGEIFRFRPKF